MTCHPVLHNYYRDKYLQDASALQINESVSNKTRDAAMLIYNRVPKSGSSTVRKMVAKLSKDNGFSTFLSSVYASHSMPTEKVRRIRITVGIFLLKLSNLSYVTKIFLWISHEVQGDTSR